jgi:hypothetical protein
VGVRFRVGSQPGVISVGRNDVPQKGTRILVTFSEKVTAAVAGEPWLDVQSLSDPSRPSSPCSLPTSVAPWNSVEAQCEALPNTDVLRVTVRSYLSADGTQMGQEAYYDLDPASLVASADGDQVLYVEPQTN